MERDGQGALLRQCAADLQAAFGVALPPGRTPGLHCELEPEGHGLKGRAVPGLGQAGTEPREG
jgi:hypothetical protein